MRALLKFTLLARSEQRLLITAACVLCVVRVSAALLPFRWVCELVRVATHHSGRWSPRRQVQPEQVGWAVSIVSGFVPGASCLPQALATYLLLHRAGYASDLRIGVRARSEGQLLARAWVEYGGEVIVGGPASALQQFTVLPSVVGLQHVPQSLHHRSASRWLTPTFARAHRQEPQTQGQPRA